MRLQLRHLLGSEDESLPILNNHLQSKRYHCRRLYTWRNPSQYAKRV